MKPDTYKLVEQCVENGVAYGWLRAHKHTDTPAAEQIQEKIRQAIMNEVCEWFQFDPKGEA